MFLEPNKGRELRQLGEMDLDVIWNIKLLFTSQMHLFGKGRQKMATETSSVGNQN